MRVHVWRASGWSRWTLFRGIYRRILSNDWTPCNARDKDSSGNYRGARQNQPVAGPSPVGHNRLYIQQGTNSRQERNRHLGVSGNAKARINGSEKQPFLFECSAASSAAGKVSVQFSLWFNAGGSRFDQRVFMMFAWHRNFSANCLRA